MALRGYDDDREQNADDAAQINGDEHDGNNGGYLDAEAGGILPCLDQSVEIKGGAWGAIAREQQALRDAAARLGGIVMRVGAAGESQPDPVSDVLDIIGPAELSGETFLITRIR